MSIRRQVGAYKWREELEEIKGLGEKIGKELVEMGQFASTVETSRRFTRLVNMTSQVSVKALELKGYQEK